MGLINIFYNTIKKSGELSQLTKKQLVEMLYDPSGEGETKKELNAYTKGDLIIKHLYDEFESDFHDELEKRVE